MHFLFLLLQVHQTAVGASIQPLPFACISGAKRKNVQNPLDDLFDFPTRIYRVSSDDLIVERLGPPMRAKGMVQGDAPKIHQETLLDEYEYYTL